MQHAGIHIMVSFLKQRMRFFLHEWQLNIDVTPRAFALGFFDKRFLTS